MAEHSLTVGHEEPLDHQGHANLAVWLGLIGLTFTTASFAAANVYLRGWNPSKFHPASSVSSLFRDLPDYDVLLMIVVFILLVISGRLFVRRRFQAVLYVQGLTTLLFFALLICDFNLVRWFSGAGPQLSTIYDPTAVIQFLLVILCVVLLVFSGWYASLANKRKFRTFFPVAMNVWMYTVVSGVVFILVENVMTVGQFAAWCGQHLS